MLKIAQLYAQPHARPILSFEFFPPKDEKGEERLFKTVEDLSHLRPDFVSVTYGAGGSTQQKTLEWVSTIQDRYQIRAMAHYTCIGASRDATRGMLQDLHAAGIRNIMALRGDPPKDQTTFQAAPDGFQYGNELIAFISQLGLDFSIGGGCYPEVHLEARSPADDLKYLKQKVDAGADFLISQLFFKNNIYFDFVERCREADIRVPIVPGIMPITHAGQIERFTAMAGCSIPEDFVKELKQCGADKEQLQKISLEYSVNQCKELLSNGVPGIHFYTLNRSKMSTKIMEQIRDFR